MALRAKILVTAAPGGHSGYAYAIGYYLRKLGAQVAFLTVNSKWLVDKLSALGPVYSATLPRRPGESLVKTLHRWPIALTEAFTLVVKNEFDALVACGSNFSIPPVIAAKLRGVRIYNVESIVRILEPAKAPKIIHKLAALTLLHWEEQLRHYPSKSRVVGPIYEPRLVEPRDEGYVLVTAGTMGNRELFHALVETSIEHAVVQTGMVDPEPLRRRKPAWRYIRFTPRLHELIARASVVVTQFPGMTSATAALAYDKPVVLVPARHLRLSARLENMRPYAEKIGAVVVERVEPRELEHAIEEAKRARRRRPQYPVGALEAAKTILNGLSENG